MSPAEKLIHAAGGKWYSNYGMMKCRCHEDRKASLSVRNGANGKILVKCHAGCSQESAIAALIRTGLWEKKRWGGTKRTRSDGKPQAVGLTLAQYASMLRLRSIRILEFGITETSYNGAPAIKIPYFDASGKEVAVRFRLSADGGQKFLWRRGDKPTLYGVDRLHRYLSNGNCVVIVEGESDCHVLWSQNQPAIGLPGAASWREEEYASLFEGFETIYIVIEPGQSGEAVQAWIRQSSIRSRVKLMRLTGFKDPREMYAAKPSDFMTRWREALDTACTWQSEEEVRRQKAHEEELESCREIAEAADILPRFVDSLRANGLVGENRNALILFLALISRLFTRPVSLALKGPSSGGKSYLVSTVLKYFPAASYYFMTGMSEKALIYSKEPLENRYIVLAEVHGIQAQFADYVIRSLLSESRLLYMTTQRTASGAFESVTIAREGPTGLIVTTTAVNLHSENETRLLSLTVLDTSEQTAAIMERLAQQTRVEPASFAIWHSLQRFLENGPREVSVPFAVVLANMIPPVAVRLRRDFSTILSLIMAHAVLHQRNRDKSPDGKIIASLDDYEAVRWLVSPIIGEGVRTTVSKQVRETVEAVAKLRYPGGVTINELAEELDLDHSAAYRRAERAIAMGYLTNAEERSGRPILLRLGEDMPDPNRLLPTVEELAEHCTIARKKGGYPSPPGA